MDRFERRYRDEERGRRYGGEPWSRERDYGRERDWGRGGRDERGFFDRAGDEVRSWFGDDEAQRRRMQDEREYDREGWRGERSASEWRSRPERHGDEWRWGGYNTGGYDTEDVDRDWARQWGYVERGGRGQSRGGQEQPRYGGSSWTERPGYGREGYGSQGYGGQAYMNQRGFGYGGQSFSPGYDSEAYGYAGMGRAEAMASGPYVGRGPRGYQRSDDRVKEDVCERMSQHGQLDASDIEVRVSNGEVTLTGSVPSRHAKRIAEDLAEGVSGVREVNNQLRVSQPQESQPGEQQSTWSSRQQRGAA